MASNNAVKIKRKRCLLHLAKIQTSFLAGNRQKAWENCDARCDVKTPRDATSKFATFKAVFTQKRQTASACEASTAKITLLSATLWNSANLPTSFSQQHFTKTCPPLLEEWVFWTTVVVENNAATQLYKRTEEVCHQATSVSNFLGPGAASHWKSGQLFFLHKIFVFRGTWKSNQPKTGRRFNRNETKGSGFCPCVRGRFNPNLNGNNFDAAAEIVRRLILGNDVCEIAPSVAFQRKPSRFAQTFHKRNAKKAQQNCAIHGGKCNSNGRLRRFFLCFVFKESVDNSENATENMKQAFCLEIRKNEEACISPSQPKWESFGGGGVPLIQSCSQPFSRKTREHFQRRREVAWLCKIEHSYKSNTPVQWAPMRGWVGSVENNHNKNQCITLRRGIFDTWVWILHLFAGLVQMRRGVLPPPLDGWIRTGSEVRAWNTASSTGTMQCTANESMATWGQNMVKILHSHRNRTLFSWNKTFLNVHICESASRAGVFHLHMRCNWSDMTSFAPAGVEKETKPPSLSAQQTTGGVQIQMLTETEAVSRSTPIHQMFWLMFENEWFAQKAESHRLCRNQTNPELAGSTV